MKATLEFQIPEDTEDFDMALHGGVLHSILCAVQQHLRDRAKYGDLTVEAQHEIDQMRGVVFGGMETLPGSLR